MGNRQAMDMAASDISLEVQIEWHLTSNHYPPVPSAMVKPCIDAINSYNTDYEDDEILLPDGITFKGYSHAPALEIIESHHLGAWLDEREDW